tara:strand:+ start:3179 stop:4051 length:873 start_codon:yes stop_codon:yes gene_type:complete
MAAVGAGWAWAEMGKTINSLGGFDYGIDFNFSNLDFGNLGAALENAQRDIADKELQTSIDAAQGGVDPVTAAQGSNNLAMGTAIVDDGLAIAPESPQVESAAGVGTQSVTDIGGTDFSGPRPVGALATVDDPESVYADVAKDRYDFVRSTIRPFQDSLIDELEDDSLIRQAPADALVQANLAEGISRRNLSRFGATESMAARTQRSRGNQYARSIAVTDALNNARVNQLDKNQALLNTLVTSANTINKTVLGQLGAAAGLQQGRERALSSAKSQAKQNKYGIIGSLFGSI